MKVAAYQAPLLASGSMSALDLVRAQVRRCEAESVSILCCPEAILGGLADYSENPAQFAIKSDDGQLASVLDGLASDTVTSIVGFTELASSGILFNAAVILHQGKLAGIYRKLHPAIRHSVYTAGSQTPVFRTGQLTFGVVICNDSNYAEPARRMAAQGASILFVPANNALPAERESSELIAKATEADVARSVENRIWVVRADVAGSNGELTCHGSSEIVDPQGNVVQHGELLTSELLVVDI
ncbi:MAG TPA: carbon-nitrogen hydrolase family protein [Blastocatellia bacterium]|nr:carbon-nitrogen hydrolase family protein [Blastocatellia bacterium]